MQWTGRVLSGLVIAFFIFDFGLKFTGMPIVTQTGEQLGWHAGTAPMLGIILAVCTALYAYPRTAILGAILLTGYLGGAVATHIRVDSPLFSHILFWGLSRPHGMGRPVAARCEAARTYPSLALITRRQMEKIADHLFGLFICILARSAYL
jgi:hypothetical protein